MAKTSCAVSTVLRGAAMILLLGAAFDVWPWRDNAVIFIAVALLIITGMVSGMAGGAKKTGCCG
ncbi:MAG: hypothetical protein WC732_03025 [Candidatus Omnitrophota bacterium]